MHLICQSGFLSELDSFLLTFGTKAKLSPNFQGGKEVQIFSPNAFLYDLDTDHFGMNLWTFDNDGKLLCAEKFKKTAIKNVFI